MEGLPKKGGLRQFARLGVGKKEGVVFVLFFVFFEGEGVDD